MDRLTALSLRWPWTTLLIAVVLAVLGAWGGASVPLSAGAYAYIGADHPAVTEFEGFIETFGGGYPVIVAWSCGDSEDPCKSVFDENSLLMADAVTKALAGVSNISRISSPANAPLLIGTADGISAHRFVKDGRVDTPPDLVARALMDSLWVGAIVSKDARVGALAVEMTSTNIADQFAVIEKIEAAISPFREGGFRFYFSGSPWIEVAAYRGSMAESQTVGAITGLVIAVVVFLLLRSLPSVISILASIGLASACAIGLLALLGWPRDPITTGAPTMVLVIGSADGIHFLTSYWAYRRRRLGKLPALMAAAKETAAPCAMTALTTAAGLLSFLGTESPAIAKFGVIAAAGVGLCLVFTFSVIPALIHLSPDLPGGALRETERWDGILQRFVAFPIEYPKSVIGAMVALTAVGGFGLTRLEADPSALQAWKPSDATRQGIEFVSTTLRPLEGLEIEIAAPGPVHDSRVIREIGRVENDLHEIDGLGEIRSLRTSLDHVANLLGSGHVGDHNFGELLVLISLSDEASIDPWLSLDQRHARISVAAPSLSVEQRRVLIDRVRRMLSSLPDNYSYRVTGPTVLHFAIDGASQRTARQSALNSTILVTLLVGIFLRSARWGLLAMIPNIVPMVVLFGLMGIWRIPLDIGSAVVAPIALGIAADDTIHLLHVYTRERRNGVGSIDAVRTATRQIGRAVVTTSLALALGFLAMTASNFQTLSNIGLLSAAAIIAALLAELLLLPALLAVVAGDSTTVNPRPISSK